MTQAELVKMGDGPLPDLKHSDPPPSASGVLRLLCRKCTKVGAFPAADRAIATMQAQARGWKLEREGTQICPRCPK